MTTKSKAQAKQAEPKLDFSHMNGAELDQSIRKAESVLSNQKHIVKAAEAYARLVRTEDFQTLVTHLKNTTLQIALGAPKRNQEAQMQDSEVMRSIATTLNIIEDLPTVGHQMEVYMEDTQKNLSALKAAK